MTKGPERISCIFAWSQVAVSQHRCISSSVNREAQLIMGPSAAPCFPGQDDMFGINYQNQCNKVC